MIKIGIESSTEMISLAGIRGEEVLFNINRKDKKGASEIIPFLSGILRKQCLDFKEIGCIVVGSGPGSFTGLRISFSVVKGLSLSLNKPVLAIGSFSSIAYKVRGLSPRIAVISDARRNLIYGALFRAGPRGTVLRQRKENLHLLKDFVESYGKKYLFVSPDRSVRNAVKSMRAGVNVYPDEVYPDALSLLMISRNYSGKKDITGLEPVYVYPKECQIKNV